MKKFSIITITILLLFNLFSCIGKNLKTCPRYFEIPVEVTPYQETYQVGDTITVNCTFHKMLYAFNSYGESIGPFNMEGINWSPAGVSCYRIDQDSVNIVNKTNEYFNFVDNQKYNLHWYLNYAGGSSIDGDFSFQNDTFNLEIKLFPKETGLFVLRFGTILVNSNQDFPGKCWDNVFDVYHIVNEGKDNHIDLLKESPDPHYNDWILQKPDDRFYTSGGYCFRVVE